MNRARAWLNFWVTPKRERERERERGPQCKTRSESTLAEAAVGAKVAILGSSSLNQICAGSNCAQSKSAAPANQKGTDSSLNRNRNRGHLSMHGKSTGNLLPSPRLLFVNKSKGY